MIKEVFVLLDGRKTTSTTMHGKKETIQFSNDRKYVTNGPPTIGDFVLVLYYPLRVAAKRY
jgi:hypothetical protein